MDRLENACQLTVGKRLHHPLALRNNGDIFRNGNRITCRLSALPVLSEIKQEGDAKDLGTRTASLNRNYPYMYVPSFNLPPLTPNEHHTGSWL